MADTETNKGEGSGSKGFVIGLVLALMIGAGAGSGFAMLVVKPEIESAGKSQREKSKPVAKTEHAEADGKASDESAAADENAPEAILPLEPIHVSLGDSKETWIRVDASIVYAGDDSGERANLAKFVTHDLVSYLHTVSLSQIDSAAGMEFLREDLSEIARLRTNGEARGILLRALMVE